MEKSIRVRLLNRDYVLRVEEGHEESTREMVGYVAARMQAFRTAHPDQSDLTAAVITALAITEELYLLREAYAAQDDALGGQLQALEHQLTTALSPG